MSSSSIRDGKRPTLPPIRDLFRDELSQPPNPGQDSPPFHDSPPLNLARLNVSEDLNERALSRPTSSSSRGRMGGPPLSYNTSTGYPPAPSNYSYDDRGLPTPQHNIQHPAQRISRSNPLIPHSYDASSRSMGALIPDHYHPVEQHSRDPSLYRSMSYSQFPQPPREQFHTGYLSHPRGVSDADYRYNTNAFPPSYAPSGAEIPPRPWAITTDVNSGRGGEDEERTPVARYQKATRIDNPGFSHSSQEESTGSSSSKYECSFCGKGFNRPSSLKIHLNSHTGEKPFICPVESCGRSFSVLSNMRRHARVHSQMPLKEAEPMSDEGDVGQASGMVMGVPHSSSQMSDLAQSRPGTQTSGWYRRRDSSASASSSSSRRSLSISSKSDAGRDDERPEKRTRHHPR